MFPYRCKIGYNISMINSYRKPSSHYHIDEISQDFGRIKRDYRFDEDDIQRLRTLIPLFEEEVDRIIPGFYDVIFSFEHARTFLYSEEIVARHKRAIRRWFMALVNGNYDEHYYRWLAGISEIHVHIGLPSHYVNCAFSYIRETLNELLIEKNRLEELPSLNKIVDINLDVLSLTYKDEEQQRLISDIVLLKNSLRSGTVEVHLQPIVDARTEEVAKYECLMRIRDPKTGRTLSVAPLLKTAKSIYLYEGLMELMVDKTLRKFESLECAFTLNLGYEDISDRRFLHYLHHKIVDFPHPERITFEILETDFIGDFNIIASFVEEARVLGCTIAIDDFGSGYSSMENIIRIKPEYIKIDGSLIEALENSEESRTIVSNTIRMIKELGAKSVAEYVSTESLKERVIAMGVDYIQGYAVGRPFPADNLTKC